MIRTLLQLVSDAMARRAVRGVSIELSPSGWHLQTSRAAFALGFLHRSTAATPANNSLLQTEPGAL